MKYEIVGDTLPVVICHLNKGEKMISDSGAMAWMDPCMKMETNGGGAGKIIGRMFSGETLFRNSYTANAYGSSFSKSLFVCRDRLILLLVSIGFTG